MVASGNIAGALAALRRATSLALRGYERHGRSLGVRIGTGCRIATANWGSEPYLIEIGDHVHVTRGVSFVTHDGGVWVARRAHPSMDVFGRISVGDGSFVGNFSTILPGVTIGRSCVIGANSVVTKSIQDGVVAAGNPARFICWTEEYLARMRKHDCCTHGMPANDKRREVTSRIGEKAIVKPNLSMTRLGDRPT
jgi:carbonic anhydrase/acetyltransferase-like protein (isoleucine patch superfamily)